MKCDSGIQQTYTNLNELNCASLKKLFHQQATIDDTQLLSRSSDTCLCLFQMFFWKGFLVDLSTFEANIEGKGERRSSTTFQIVVLKSRILHNVIVVILGF